MIFLTVGTLFPFDRLVRTVDTMVGEGLVQDEIVAQIGHGSSKPKHMQYTEVMERDTFQQYITEASSLIGHAGIGTIAMALDNKKPLLVMPRMKHYKEHVNDHQVMTAKKFEELGHVLVAYETEELPNKIKQLKSFIPEKRQAKTEAVAQRISIFLKQLSKSKNK